MRNELYAKNPKTVRYVTETPKIWALLPQNIKDSSSLPTLTSKFTLFLMRVFIIRLGFH